jgi:hypothetical protein
MMELRDIHGLDPLPWWPLADGWWVLLGIAVSFLLLYALLQLWLYRIRRDWRLDARRLLKDLKRRLRGGDARQAAIELSELLRRIAMARFGRRSCAGLTGNDWLEWLRKHDPHGFDWTTEGRLLLELPYAPPGARVQPILVHDLINAALGWVEAEGRPGLFGRKGRV